jgi:uncharacterized protein
MDCPIDNQPMIVLELEQIEIDYCTHCSGIWLDSGELELMVESENERDYLNSLFKQDLVSKEKSVGCPICSKKMIKVDVGKNNEVLIDKCPKNHGLWFDKGELEKVLFLGSKGKENKIISLLKQIFENKLTTNE